MLVPIAIFGVLLILLVVFLIKSAETWSWIPITLCALIFLTSIFAGISASRVLKTRRAWKKQALENEATLARVQAQFDEALVGPQDAVGGYGEGSLRQVNSELLLSQIAKGRVWSGGLPARTDEQYTLTFTPGDGVPQVSTQVTQDMVLFAFEASDRLTVPGGGSPPAAEFVGKFKVVNSGGNDVTLQPVFMTKFYYTGSLMRQLSKELSDNTNQDKINGLYIELSNELSGDMKDEFITAWEGGQGSNDMSAVITWLDDNATAFEPVRKWALFENMPGDRHDVFRAHAGLADFSDDNPATSEMLAEYRALLASTYLPADVMGMDAAGEGYEELLDQYNFDGARTNEIEQFINQNAGSRVSDRFVMMQNDEHIYGKVRYIGPSEAYQVDGSGILSRDGRFDLNGGTNDPDLKLNKDVTFDKDTEVILPKVPAVQEMPMAGGGVQAPIVERNDAEWMGVEYFVRPLRDYPFLLNELRNLKRRVSEQTRAVESDIADTQRMIDDSGSQVDHRSLMQANLQQDIDAQEAALAEINRLYDLREKQLKECREQIRTYYNQIIELYKEANESSEFLDTSNQKTGETLANSR